ncbi:MAG: M48 family metalloprotease [Leptolyngbyaceae cyanobacterium RU_5_1]|nr:M48 family metalloprotease [Leptolyngbyaceae cyanobacterium RU_5_1]
MTTSPEASSTRTNFGTMSDLEVGLAAFKQGDYAAAVALLEVSLSAPADHPLTTRAQMGLAIAYERVGETLQAARVCQFLRQNPDSSVQEWATRTFETLVKRHPELSALSGMVENTPHSADVIQESEPVEPEGDLSGFMPFVSAAPPLASPASQTNPEEEDVTGFVPFSSTQDTAPLPTSSAESDRTVAPSDPTRSEQPAQAAVLSRSGSARAPQPSTLADTPEPTLYQPVWRNAGRAQTWKPLGRVNPIKLLVVQIITAIALFWFIQQSIYWLAVNYSIALTKIPLLEFRRTLFNPPVWPILIGLIILFVGSRWLLDGLLTVFYGLQPLSVSKLSTYSPETARSLSRFCRQKRLPMPALGVLPTAAPIAFSYGVLPWVTRTVVSQGLLEQLEDDEIATIYASEVGHLAHWDVPLISLIAVVLQLPYTLYRVAAEWGDRKQATISRASATLIAAVSYGLYWLLRGLGLWLSQQRIYYSDRVAVDLTGNPNGYARALLKIAIGTASDIQQQGQTSYLLEGFDVLTPLGHRMATPLGSLYPYTALESILEWERTNPYRHWLSISNSHPPTGERLNLLMLYARHWRLDNELVWSTHSPTQRTQRSGLTGRQWQTLLLQGAPFFGIAFGFAIAGLLGLMGWFGRRIDLDTISWLARDRTIFRGLPLIGFCIGTLIRINPFFPDTTVSLKSPENQSSLPTLLNNPASTPVHSQPVRLEGKLLGRRGIGNVLNQDLLLQTATGLVRLHCTSRLGALGDLLPHSPRLVDLVKQDLVATGWFRRGATPWVDVEALRTVGGRVHHSHHPIWSTLLGLIAALWGILIILNF